MLVVNNAIWNLIDGEQVSKCLITSIHECAPGVSDFQWVWIISLDANNLWIVCVVSLELSFMEGR